MEIAVLFADVSGSTRLYELAGDKIAAAAIDCCIALLKQKTLEAGGRVVKTIGDEVMAVFPGADAAAHAAMEMQAGVAQLDTPAACRLAIRVGLNFGPVVEKEGDVFGDAVNVAARLASQAQRDEIITSSETVSKLSVEFKAACRRLYTIQVKGREQPVELCQIIWQESDDELTTLVSAQPTQLRSTTLRLRYRSQEIALDATHTSLLLGRDKSAALVIQDSKASRAHCKIERRMDKFYLIDHSANGTYVSIDGDHEVVLRREEITLRGRGSIALGQPRAQTAEVVEFCCA